jgi:gamma-glutamyl:cysteine ligase YbdK (ATP-grasp superfamily)
MGIEIDKTEFTAQDYARFQDRLEHNLAALAQVLADPAFGLGPRSLGAELEMYLVDAAGRPLFANQEILAESDDPQLTLELNRYNLEYNLTPYTIGEQPFRATEREIVNQLEILGRQAARHGGRIVPIGILPTLRQEDFGPHCITDRRRYHALVQQLIRRRGSKFHIDINGPQPLQLEMEDITLEGANTSFQVHYRVDPRDYADTFNAVQLMTPLAVALGANSPTLFGHVLWQETRVPLFKQSIDTRHLDRYGWNAPARVHFGRGWARQGALELFTEVVRIYEPLLPICDDIDPLDELAAGSIPFLAELRLHQSTAWLWNRPIYDNVDGGMLRIEMRALPAGPTAVDMVANGAFLIGLAEGIRPQINELLPGLPFQAADYNFYRAAQHGLAAKLVWPDVRQYGCREQPITEIIEEMLPVAAAGLHRIGVDYEEANYYLGVIERRLRSRQTGAAWQLAMLDKLNHGQHREKALHQMLEHFIARSHSNTPVAEWPL